MKKTIIITVVIIAVLAIVYFVFGKSESKEKDEETPEIKAAREEAEKTAAENKARQEQIAALAAKRADEINSGLTTANELKDLGVAYTASEYKEKTNLETRYFNATGISAKDMTLETLRVLVPQVEEAKKQIEALQKAFPSEKFDVDYGNVTVANSNYDEAAEIQALYDKLSNRDKEIQQMVVDFVNDLQVGSIWGDVSKNSVLKTIVTGGISLFRDNAREKNAKWTKWTPWDTTTLNKMLKLTEKERQRFTEILRQKWEDFPENTDDDKLIGGDKYKNAVWAGDTIDGGDSSGWGIKSGNVSVPIIMTANGLRPGATGYVKRAKYLTRRDDLTGNVPNGTYAGMPYSTALYKHFNQ